MTSPTSNPPTLRQNVQWAFTGNAIYAISQWAILVVLARMGSTVIVGQFALALAVTTPVIMLANLQLRWIQATDSTHEFAFADCLALRLVCLAVAMGVLFLITRVAGYDAWTTALVLVMGVAKSIESICDVIYGWYQQHEHMDYIARSLIVRGPLSILAIVIGHALGGGLLGACVGLALMWAAVLLTHDARQAIHFYRTVSGTAPDDRKDRRSNASAPPDFRVLLASWHWDRDTLYRIFWRALPVGLTAGVVALLVNIPRYVVSDTMGDSQLGIFAAMAYALLAVETLVRAVNQSAMPRLASCLAQSNVTGFYNVLSKLTWMGVGCGVVATLAAWLLGPVFLRYVYGEAFATSPQTLTWMVAGAAISYGLRPAEVALRSMRKFQTLLIIHSLSVPLLLAGCWWAIPKYGLWGAAIAMLVQVLVHGLMTLAVFLAVAPRPIGNFRHRSPGQTAMPIPGHTFSTRTPQATTQAISQAATQAISPHSQL